MTTTAKKKPKKKPPTPTDRLVAAMQRCALARGEVQWTNGYRTAKGAEYDKSPDGGRLYCKEVAQWGVVSRADRNFRRLAQRLTRGAR